MKLSYSKKAFTLIELLIVVAIIAILAAIAVPNFLEAQVRAKVSRTKADLRTMATAIESYAVDNNKPPRAWRSGNPYFDPQINGQNVSGIVWPGGLNAAGTVFTAGLSTPISYVTNALLTDPFVNLSDNIAEDEKTFTYQQIEYYVDNSTSAFWPAAREFYGEWRMCSIGPDRDFSNNDLGGSSTTNAAQIEYDSSNGTVSAGNIWRSQKHSDQKQPPEPLVGPH